MEKKTHEILLSIKHDINCLVLDFDKDDNKYHYDLAVGNLSDLINNFCVGGD